MAVMMKPLDAGWFYVEKPDAPAHFGPLIIISLPDGAAPTYVRDLVEQWRQCQQFQAPFNYLLRRRLWPSWEVLPDEAIDLEYHFRHSALPAPGGERELGTLISRLQSYRLDRRRPLWECHVIEGLENRRFAIYLKLHHGQLDGMGAARLIARIFSEDPAQRGAMPPWSVGMSTVRRQPEAVRSETVPAVQAGAGSRAGRRQRIGWLPRLLSLGKAVMALSRLKRDARSGRYPDLAAPFQAPATMFNGRIGSQRRFATQRYELARLKAVAKAGGVTLNDVFLAISGGALRRYLGELGALPAQSLVGQVPVSVRPSGDASVGNSIAFIYASLRSDIADPVARLHAVRASMEAGKARHEALPASAIDTFTLLLVGPYMMQIILGLGGYLRPSANLVVSNVTGPRQRLYFNGARVEQIYGPSVLFHGQALNITLSSYVDEINIGFTGCRSSLPSMQRLAVYTGEALEALEAALGVARSEADTGAEPDAISPVEISA